MDIRLGLAVGAALLLTACGAGSTPTAGDPAASSTPSATPGVVPWADLPPAHEGIVTTTVAAAPDPAAAEVAPPCRADQLRARPPDAGAAAGTEYWIFTIRLRGRAPCRVEGVPPMTVVTSDGAEVRVEDETADSGSYHDPVLVTPGSPALLRLGWGSDWCAAPLTVTAERLALPGGTLSLPGLGHSPACNDTGSADHAPLMVWPFQPKRYRPEHVVSPWDHVRLSTDPAQLRGRHSATVDFLVTMTSQDDLSLSPCPDYAIEIVGDAVHRTAPRQLDCAAVPYEKDGTPYLPAGTPVRFAMHLTVPDDATRIYKVWWYLPADPDSIQYGAGTLLRAPD